MNRREAIRGCAALAALAVLPPGMADAAELPLLPPLEPLDPMFAALMEHGIRHYGPAADDPSIPLAQRVLWQHVCARRHLRLAWPEADALRRFQAVADHWPLLRPNIDRAMQARIEEREGWDTAGDWDYSRVRIDQGWLVPAIGRRWPAAHRSRHRPAPTS